MPLKRRIGNFPPGGYPFFISETDRKFPGMVDFDTQAREIAKYRRGNKMPRSTLEECLEDLDEYTCARLGYDPNYCYNNSGRPTEQAVTRVVRKCGGCGARRKK